MEVTEGLGGEFGERLPLVLLIDWVFSEIWILFPLYEVPNELRDLSSGKIVLRRGFVVIAELS